MFKHLSLAAGVLGLGFSLSVAAAEGAAVHSEPMHQANEGTFEITPGIGVGPSLNLSGLTTGFTMTDKHARNSTLELKSQALPVDLSVEYGINYMFSVGAAVEYDNTKAKQSNCAAGVNCISPTLKGISNPLIYAKGRFMAGTGEFQYGLNARISLEKGKISSNGDRNVDTGGHTFIPFVGYQVPIGQSVGGVQVSYVAYKTDAKVHNDSASPSTDTATNGNTDLNVSLFYEMPFEGFALGGIATLDHSPSSRSKLNGGAAISNDNDYTKYNFEVYAPIAFQHLTFIPNVFYGFQDYSSTGSVVSHGNEYGVGASFRFML